MKKIIILLLALTPFIGFSQSICIAVDCKDSIYLPEDTISLNSTANGFVKVLSMGWKQVTGLPGKIDNPGVASTVCRGLTAGQYVFAYTYTTTNGSATLFDTVIVRNAPPPPVALIQPVPDITLPFNQVILNAYPSFDPNGGPLTYKWSKVSGPAGDSIQSANSMITVAKVAAPSLVGKYIYQLQVTSANGTSTALVSFTVNPVPVYMLFSLTIASKTTEVYSDGSIITK